MLLSIWEWKEQEEGERVEEKYLRGRGARSNAQFK
jgi:hypothetical protein